MSNPFKTADFKRLQNEWYEKLQNEGFKDEEKGDFLKKHHNLLFQSKLTKEQIFYRSEYFRYATHFLNTFKFQRLLDKNIWELHVDGISSRKIALILRTTTLKLNKDNVTEILNTLKRHFKDYLDGEGGTDIL